VPSTYAQFKRRRDRFLAAGTCGYCGREPYAPGKKICDYHRQKHADSFNRRRHERIAEGKANGKPICARCLRPMDEYSVGRGVSLCMGCMDIRLDETRRRRLKKG